MWMNKYFRVFLSLYIFEFFVWLNVFFSLGVRGLVRNLSIKAARSNPPVLLHYTPCTNPGMKTSPSTSTRTSTRTRWWRHR